MTVDAANIMLLIILFGSHSLGVALELQLTSRHFLITTDSDSLHTSDREGTISVAVSLYFSDSDKFHASRRAFPIQRSCSLGVHSISKRNKDWSPRYSGEDTTQGPFVPSMLFVHWWTLLEESAKCQ